MKQNVHAKLFILGLVVMGLFLIRCGKSGENPGQEIIEQLIDSFNKQLPGSKFKTDLEKSIVEPAGNNRYLITFKNLSITTDLILVMKAANKVMSSEEEDFSSVLYTVYIDEAVVLYGPREKYLSAKSISGITIDHDFSPFEGKQEIPNLGELKVEKVHAAVGNLIFPGMDISGLIKDNKKDPVKKKRLGSKKQNTAPLDTICENIKLEINYTLNHGNNFSIVVEVEKFVLNLGIDNPYFSSYLFNKAAPPPDFNKILQKGMKVMGSNFQSGKIKFSIKRKGHQWDLGLIDNISFSNFLEPGKTGKFFKFGYELGIKNFRLIFPLKQEIEMLANVKELRFTFSMEHLNPQAILAFMNFMNTVTELRDMTDNSKIQENLFQNMQFLVEVFQSKPVFKLSISPFKHYFGELEAKVELGIKSLFSMPDVRMSVDVLKIDEILKKLEDIHVFSPTTFKSISGTIGKLFVRKENGDAAMTIEFKSDQPGTFFFNGRQMPFDSRLITGILNKRLPRIIPR